MIRQASVFACALLMPVAASSGGRSPAPPLPSPERQQSVSVQQIISAVRRTVGFARLARLEPGISISDQRADGGEVTSLLGIRAGEYRLAESGFDGSYRWQFDARRGRAIPNSLRQHEKAAWPLWIRGHWWLNPASKITVALDQAQSTPSQYALSLQTVDGTVPATLFVNRQTMLPDRLVVQYDRGPFEARYSQWVPFAGVLIARQVATTYRNEAVVHTRSISRLASGEFGPPAPPKDWTFDARAPAVLPVRRGPDFAAGQRGHSFVPARVNGSAAGWWLVDSGADGMLIDERLADELHMPILGESVSIGADGKPRRATLRRGQNFTVGRLTYLNPVFIALDLTDATAPKGEKRSGVIGYDVFARAVVEYGRDGDDVAICDPARLIAFWRQKWRSLDYIDQTPAVRTRFEGNREGLFQIDTGAAGSVDFYKGFIDAHHLLDSRNTVEVQSVGAGGSFRMRAGRIAWIDLGGERFRNVEAGFRMTKGRDGAGVIGRALLRPFTTVFDYTNRRIAFVRAAGSGMTLAERTCR